MLNTVSRSGHTAKQKPKKIRRSKSQWLAIIKEFRQSSLGSQAFCRANGIAESSFYKWRSRLSGELLERQTDIALPVTNRFIEITPATLASEKVTQDWAVELAIGEDLILRIRQPV